MSTYNQDRELVDDLKVIMLGKLRANRHKAHWRILRLLQLLDMLKAEVKELEDAITTNDKISSIKQECADVAIFCAMISDNLGEETE